MIGYYLTHPQVDVEPDRPVPLWRLSQTGRDRVHAALAIPWLRSVARIVSSGETKAVEAAAIVAGHLAIPMMVHARMAENDRSSTGFLDPAAFEAAADCFFAEPDRSWNGWERAQDAQVRIVAAVEDVLAVHDPARAVLFVGHGAVGTLLKCWLGGRAISRNEDQPAGGGNCFAFRLSNRALLCDWTPMERFVGGFDEA